METSLPHQPRWQVIACWFSAIFLSVLFAVSGAWKLSAPLDWAARLIQMTVPGELSMPGTLAVGVSELFGGVLILIPRFRRWGAFIIALLLVIFIIFVGLKYDVLRGAECSCFPWLKRAVGPMFFVVDLLWLLMALAVAHWARPSSGVRAASFILGVVCVFAGASYGINLAQQSGIEAPDKLTIDGQPGTVKAGKVFLYFFDPECMHCFEAAKRMKDYAWKDVKVITVPTRVPHFAGQFLKDTGLKAPVAAEVDALRERFKFTDPPCAVLLEHGRQKHAFIQFDEKQPHETLKQLGYIE
ncbi:MAG: DoxX family protein [Acidobacteria bacterium]|nr:DoxX family protein [Acidobacteriota bacterium]